MPFLPAPIPTKHRRNAVLQIRGPREKKHIDQLNKELRKVLRKHGAKYKKPRTTRKKRTTKGRHR
jgi:hypothetical protein